MKRSQWNRAIRKCYEVDQAEVAIALSEISSRVAKRVTRGHEHGVPQHEVTITQTSLLDIARRLPDLRISTFTQQEEGQNGSDWEWWIEGGQSWFGYRVQAKRLMNDSYSFGHLVSQDSNRAQLDLLIESANKIGIPSIYALYNHAAPAGTFSSHGSAPCFPPRAEGITFVSATTVRERFGKNTVKRSKVAPFAMPWSCLAGCACLCPTDAPLYAWTRDLSQDSDFLNLINFDGPITDPALTAAWRMFTLGSLSPNRRQGPFNSRDEFLQEIERTQIGWFPERPPEYVETAIEAPDRSLAPDLYANGDQRVAPPAFVVIQSFGPQ